MKTIVLFSAGLDSATVLAMELAAGNSVLALTIDYGQSNKAEIERAKTLASYWGFPHKIIPIHLERTDARAEIPARNTIFLAKALEWALLSGAERVAYGAEPDATYADSSLAYIKAMASLMALHGVELVAPIRSWSGKLQVLKQALDLGVPLDLVHSSRTDKVDGGCKASARFLNTLHSLFPAVNPVWLLHVLEEAHQASNLNPYDLRSAQTGSFKWIPALLTLAARSTHEDSVQDVYTTGNWGKSMRIANSYIPRFKDINEILVKDSADLKRNRFNTDSETAQWGIKQALSRLPRSRCIDSTIRLSFRKTQGHLEKAVASLGYTIDQQTGIPLITE